MSENFIGYSIISNGDKLIKRDINLILDTPKGYEPAILHVIPSNINDDSFLITMTYYKLL